MGLLKHLFFLHLLILEFNAYIDPPGKNSKEGFKSKFFLAPYISFVRDQKVKELREEIKSSWPEGIITYYIDVINYDMFIEARIRTAMSVLEAAACIRFKVKKEKPKGNITWIHITNPSKKRQCVHDPNLPNKGEIVLILGYDCLGQKQLLHTLLHGIGFKDEVTHPHRNNYIKVIWDNIQPVYRHLYKIQHVENSRSIVEYDPLSIMHFHDRAFSSNGKATIVPLESGLIISPSESLSQLDKMRLQLYFGHECNKRKFSSLMETCIKSLKDEQEIPPDEDNRNNNDETTDVGNVDEEGTIEKKKKKSNTDKHVEFANMTKNEKEMEDLEDNLENIKENKKGGMKKNQKGHENSGEKMETEDIKKNKKRLKEGREYSNENIVPDGMKKNQKGHENSGEKIETEIIKKYGLKEYSKKDYKSRFLTYTISPEILLKNEGKDSESVSGSKDDVAGVNLYDVSSYKQQ